MERLNHLLKGKIEENNELKNRLASVQNRPQPQVNQQELNKLKALLEMKSTELEQTREKLS